MFTNFRREHAIYRMMASDYRPHNRKTRLLITHRKCPLGEMAKSAVIRFNRTVPPERRIDIINLYVFDGKVLNDLKTHPLVDAIISEYGRTKCPTLVFDGGIYQGILDDEEYFHFLKKLDELFNQ